MEPSESEKDRDPQEVVIDKLKAEGFRIVDKVEGLELNPPRKDELLGKLSDEHLKQTVGLLYDFLETPMLEYPDNIDTQVDTEIDRVDQKLRDQFEGDELNAYEEVLKNNKYKIGKLTTVMSTLSLAPVIAPESTQKELSKINENIHQILDPVLDYKTKDKQFKKQVVKQYTKAAGMTLRVLDGQKIDEDEFNSLTDFVKKH